MLGLILASAVALGDCPRELGFVNNDLPAAQGAQIEVSYRWIDDVIWYVAGVVPAGTPCMAHPQAPRRRCFRVRWLNPDSDYSAEQCELAPTGSLNLK